MLCCYCHKADILIDLCVYLAAEIIDCCVESAEEPSTLLDPLPPLPDFDW